MVMTKTSFLKADPTPWLLELDNPSIRYFTLADLLERPQSDAEVRQAKAAIMTSEPVQKILDAQYPDGYWIKPGIGYSPKYRATVWQVIFLADLGATRTAQIKKACEHIFEHAQRPDGAFIANKGKNGAIICLNGNLLRSLLWFGCGDDPRGQRGLDWLAARVHGDGGFLLPLQWTVALRLGCDQGPFSLRCPAGRRSSTGHPEGYRARGRVPPELRSGQG
jgi:hypothetical protein